jgi:hypothetical protein
MLGGLEPVIIFQFSKLSLADTGIADIPVISNFPSLVEQPPIPLYLSESLTGVFIDTEDKNVDIQTDTETLSSGAPPDVNQKGIASSVSINLLAKKDSIGIALLSAMIDLIFDKVTSKEYAISYLHGATTVFRGVLHSYQVSQNSNDDLITIKIELSKGTKNTSALSTVPTVPAIAGVTPL